MVAVYLTRPDEANKVYSSTYDRWPDTSCGLRILRNRFSHFSCEKNRSVIALSVARLFHHADLNPVSSVLYVVDLVK